MTHSEAVFILFGSVPKTLNRSIIQKAFSQKIKSVHPDLNEASADKNPGAVIARIKEARDFLERSPWVSPISSRVFSRTSSRSQTQSQTRWIPQRPLRFGQYLYYRGLVDWTALIEGILHQRNSRPPFGELAKELGFLDDKAIAEIRRNLRPGEFMGTRALALGFLDDRQVRHILKSQARYFLPLGRIFVQRGVLTSEELTAYLRDFQSHNRAYHTGPHRP